jgi:hypothetical protein
LGQVLGCRPEADFDGQGHQVLLCPVVDVAFQPPPLLILRRERSRPFGNSSSRKASIAA